LLDLRLSKAFPKLSLVGLSKSLPQLTLLLLMSLLQSLLTLHLQSRHDSLNVMDMFQLSERVYAIHPQSIQTPMRAAVREHLVHNVPHPSLSSNQLLQCRGANPTPEASTYPRTKPSSKAPSSKQVAHIGLRELIEMRSQPLHPIA
jgi:hypothetical protein